jgi:bifunctional UDP-N-acetylglucosamine pyrophosphorylase / glucosamine-1-phosphate N-acetyltransferase
LVGLVDAKQMGLLTVVMKDATGYGRIVRNAEQQVVAIVEHKDANAAQREIREVNTGIMAVPTARLKQWLPALKNDNAQGEYYLTDIIAMAVADGLSVQTLHPEFAEETNGVNNRLQQAELERWHQAQLSRKLMEQGVTLLDPARIDIRGELICGRDVVIDINAVFEGRVELADGVYIGPNCVIKNSVIGAGSEIEAYSHLEEATLAADCHVGPYARLRPGADLANKAKVGNFVEIKKSKIGTGSKVNHLSYIGDATLGSDVNVGAGTITCNYDGVNKFKTEIGDSAFIGSNSSLVAPVKIGAFATVGAGSTITKDVNDKNLAVARGKQVQIDHWQRPVKK